MDNGIIKKIENVAVENGLEPATLYGVVMAESTGNPHAMRYEPKYRWLYKATDLAPAGCSLDTEIAGQKTSWGLMQIMGAVARERGFRGWFPELCDPEIGLEFGCKQFIHLARVYGPQDYDAIAAYNFGSPKKTDSGDYINQDYVDRVLNFAAQYRSNNITATPTPPPVKWPPASPDPIIKAMEARNYSVFRGGRKNLNIVGLRSSDKTGGKFDDYVCVFWQDAGEPWKYRCYTATTDPGVYWMQNPMRVTGAAILKPGQYKSALAIGYHRGSYRALIQAKPMTVIRDNNRDDILDWDSGYEETGLFGINLHRASAHHPSVIVDRWSAGCQVVADPDDFRELMQLADDSAALYGNAFTYTLLTEADVRAA